MSDNSDKTVIKASPRIVENNDDATRISSPLPKNDNHLPDEKTRIATPKTRHEDQLTQEGDDKTAPSNTDENDHITRFNPKPNIPVEKTRIKIPVIERDEIDDFKQQADNTDGEVHGILKDRFVLEEVLGAGGMGVVYKAKDLLKVEAQDRDPYVAIKVLGEEFKTHPEAFISLQRESRKSQRIAHPNIVNVYDFDKDGDTVFMTMEYMEGSPLDKLIRQYKSTGLPTDDAWSIIDGMSQALLHAHAENIVHSDFKPGNVFVTTKGVAKVFDFGISRAVAIADHGDDNPEDKTIFDAGSLGALTPAYASLEMLLGKEPDYSDDVYALGCVAYEMLTGSHPYNKVPADEAEKQGLKPKRIPNIKKYQWKAIEKAIALRRENRTPSIEKFLGDISPKLTKPNRLVPILALLVTAAVTTYFVFFQEKEVDPYAEFNIRNELELKVRIDFYKEKLTALLKDPTFTKSWQDEVWKDISDLMKLTRGKDDWVIQQKNNVYQMYLPRIDDAIKGYKLKDAKALLNAARHYPEDQDELDRLAQYLDDAYKKLASRSSPAPASSSRSEPEVNNEPVEKPKATPKKDKVKLFDLAMANVTEQLKCNGRINMADLGAAVTRLREINLAKYNQEEPKIVTALGECITQIGKAFPQRAIEAKKQSLRIFKNNRLLSGITIKPRDPCDLSLAGLGARGKRAICKDKIAGRKDGPDLVVIPGSGGHQAFAIGKYEVSIAEFNLFCKSTTQCAPITGRDSSLPASGISFNTAKQYLRWLSKESGEKYRLPTRNEWLYAASARRNKLDPNRNCKLSARGIQKGDELVETNMGAQNGWGVVNYVGNVQEWVYDKGRKLVAVGGSYKQPMDECTIKSIDNNASKSDIITGFRVLRELRSKS